MVATAVAVAAAGRPQAEPHKTPSNDPNEQGANRGQLDSRHPSLSPCLKGTPHLVRGVPAP